MLSLEVFLNDLNFKHFNCPFGLFSGLRNFLKDVSGLLGQAVLHDACLSALGQVIGNTGTSSLAGARVLERTATVHVPACHLRRKRSNCGVS